MNEFSVDIRFTREALDGLKSLGMKPTIDFMKEAGLPYRKNLQQMWSAIEGWLNKDVNNNCIKLLEYVDDLKLWGKQRIFLFKIEDSKIIKSFLDDNFLRGLAGDLYDRPVYKWDIEKPTLVHVKREADEHTGDSLLIFKFIETRKFKAQVNLKMAIFEERSTNFLVINLSAGIAELRLQHLPQDALLNIKEEYRLFIEEIRLVLKDAFDSFTPMGLERVMQRIISKKYITRKHIEEKIISRDVVDMKLLGINLPAKKIITKRKIYISSFEITLTTFAKGMNIVDSSSTLLTIVNHLFANPWINNITGYWILEQEIKTESKIKRTSRVYSSADERKKTKQNKLWVINKFKGANSKLYFQLFSHSNSIDIGSNTDPSIIRDFINEITEIYDNKLSTQVKKLHGLMDSIYNKLEGQPKAQSVVLAAGAIAGLIIWVIADALVGYFYEKGIQIAIGEIPAVVVPVILEIIWIVIYYGWKRTVRSFKAIWHFTTKQIWFVIMNAKKNREKVSEELRKNLDSHYLLVIK
jgi:hypothetical protein